MLVCRHLIFVEEKIEIILNLGGVGISQWVCKARGAGLVLVALHVQGQVVRAREAAAAGDAFEGLGAGVFAVVTRQLVRTRKPPVAALPGAAVRLLTCKRRRTGEIGMDR